MDLMRRHSLFGWRVGGLLFSLVLMSAVLSAQPPPGNAVYVMGNVVHPMGVPFRESLTLTQAIAIAGGPLTDKKNDKVRVLRIFDKNKIITCVSLRAIKKSRTEDLQLQENDILEVARGKCAHPLCWEIFKQLPPPFRIIK